jgi:predicted SnoaL-like aldol condensation-catalyzing enzyme
MRKYTTGLLFSVSAALALTTVGLGQNARAADAEDATPPSNNCSAATIEANRRAGEAFNRPGRTSDEAYDLMAPDYKQHNPVFKRFGEINNLHGREEFKSLLEMMRTTGQRLGPPPDPKAPKGNSTYRVIADCHYVVVLSQRYLPDPQNEGKFYESFWTDIWRVKDGKLAEHWDEDRITAPIPEFLKTPIKDMKPAAPSTSGPAAGN